MLFIKTPTKSVKRKATKLATGHDDCYSDCGQTNVEKKTYQKYYSKIIEWAFERYIINENKYKIITPVDYKYYPPNKRKWKEDLTIQDKKTEKTLKVSLKSTTLETAKKYGISWSWQCDRKRRVDPIIDHPENYLVALGIYAYDKAYGVYIGEATKIWHLLKAPKVSILKNKKQCIYLKDIDKNLYLQIKEELKI